MVATRTALLSFLCFLSLSTISEGRRYKKSYKPYPDEALALLNSTVERLYKDAPDVRVLVTLPGKDYLDHLQEVAVRNTYQNHLFKFDLNYIMEDGVTYGCRVNKTSGGRLLKHRKPPNDNAQAQVNKNKKMCGSHCTHHGRYCPAFPKDELAKHTSQNGRDLVLEVLRRLCMTKLFVGSYSDPNFFEYVNHFADDGCLENPKLGECSMNILQNKIHGFNVAKGSKFDKCVMEAEADTDKTNPLLEDSLKFSLALKDYTPNQLPVMEINGAKYAGKMRADGLQHTWCSHFKGELKPVSCDFCAHCNNMKNCLWLLRCDGHKFDVKTYKNPKYETALQIVEDDVEEVADMTIEILAAGVGIGMAVTALLWCLVEIKRKRAVAEVGKELPMDGFRDNDDSGFTDNDDSAIELHEIS